VWQEDRLARLEDRKALSSGLTASSISQMGAGNEIWTRKESDQDRIAEVAEVQIVDWI
jgi:hypothetical protein